MFDKYLKTGIRILIRKKEYSFINIGGLAIGLASALMILLFVQDELSYDRFHEHADRTYRVCIKARMQGSDFHAPISPAPMAETMVDEFPEVIQAARIWGAGIAPNIRFGEKTFMESAFAYADSSIFEIFSFPLVKGDPSRALARPNTLVMTEQAARKYFGDEDPIGQIVEVGTARTHYEITGIMKNMPSNSHFRPEVLASLVSHPESRNPMWVANNFYTYILLNENADLDNIHAGIHNMLLKHLGPQVESVMGMSFQDFLDSGNEWGYYLQPLTSIHLHSNLQYELNTNGSLTTVIVFSIIAVFILMIAGINFMNLSTARSSIRAKEIGIKKVVGSSRIQLIKQFLGESVFMSFISLLLAIILVELFIPAFNNLTGKQLHLNLLAEWYTIPALVLIALFVGLFSGSYPAFFLASFKPVKVLKGSIKSGKKGAQLRGVLVVFQFTITIVLLISTLTVYRQMNFIRSASLGFSPEQVLVIQRAYSIPLEQRETFCEAIENIPGVLSASKAQSLPGTNFSGTAFRREGTSSQEQFVISFAFVDWDYAKTLGIELTEGRFFSRDFASDTLAVVLNESAVKAMGFNDPLNQRVLQTATGGTPENPEDLPMQIIGVMKDFHFESLHKEIHPLIFGLEHWGGTIIVKMTKHDPSDIIQGIQDVWEDFVDDQPLDYTFLQDDLQTSYRSEERTGLIFTIFAILSIFIACLGLLGLASFLAEKKTKEIGIRKALGASITSIVRLLSREIIVLVLISTLIGWPMAWYFMDQWLQNFAYRIDQGLISFLLASGITFLVAQITVSYQALKAALANPVESLRYE